MKLNQPIIQPDNNLLSVVTWLRSDLNIKVHIFKLVIASAG